MKKIVQKQNKIRWDQAIQGIISKIVIKIQEKYLKANKHITKMHRNTS